MTRARTAARGCVVPSPSSRMRTLCELRRSGVATEVAWGILHILQMSVTTQTYRDLLKRFDAMQPRQQTLLIGVDGAGGSGKSTFAQSLRLCDPDRVTVVEMDDFVRPSAHRPHGVGAAKPIGEDFEWRRVADQVLDPLNRDEVARYQRYDWDLDALAEWIDVAPGGVVVVEGVYATRRELWKAYDLRVWVDAPAPVRLTRGLARDGEQARSRWKDDWMPAEARYAQDHDPRASADLVIDGSPPESVNTLLAFAVADDRLTK
jgi:uridine kinase